MAMFNTSLDNDTIDFGDDVDEDVLATLMAECDLDFNGYIGRCEMFTCMVMIENEYRTNNCPHYGLAYCPLPYSDGECEPECPGEWDCETIAIRALDV
jgi:hypothetical protein